MTYQRGWSEALLDKLDVYYSEAHEGKSLLLYDDVLTLLHALPAPTEGQPSDSLSLALKEISVQELRAESLAAKLEKVKALVERWRKEARYNVNTGTTTTIALDTCAGELEAALGEGEQE